MHRPGIRIIQEAILWVRDDRIEKMVCRVRTRKCYNWKDAYTWSYIPWATNINCDVQVSRLVRLHAVPARGAVSTMVWSRAQHFLVTSSCDIIPADAKSR